MKQKAKSMCSLAWFKLAIEMGLNSQEAEIRFICSTDLHCRLHVFKTRPQAIRDDEEKKISTKDIKAIWLNILVPSSTGDSKIPMTIQIPRLIPD